ncbi:MAG TPA: DUF1543 domain-containing protein [Agriterribacter sp.]|nr:DUF1543 domain-containing protein [Agriterribacter sp.]
MRTLKLFMLILGSKPQGRHTEQHDIFFGIGYELRDLLPAIYAFWPEADGKIHIDSWREVSYVDGYTVNIIPRDELLVDKADVTKLFFLNLGGYKEHDMEEYHYKMLVACADKGVAVQQAKSTAFYLHTGFDGAVSHIDDKYGVDVDDVYEITDILPDEVKEKYAIRLSPSMQNITDELHVGYLKLEKLAND